MVETRRSSASTKRPPSGPSPSTPPSSKRPKEEAGVSPKGQREESNKEAAAAADNQQLNSDQPGKDPPTEAAKPGVGYAVQTLAGERATKAESRNHGLSSVDNSSRKSTTEGCMGKAYFTALSAQKSKTAMHPLFTETPETEIARLLAHLLIGRIDNVIHRLRQHQDSKVHLANAGVLKQLKGILLSNRRLRIDNLHKKISNKLLQDWLWRYKDFFYMTEDVLDDLDFIIVLPSGGDDLSAFGEQMLISMKAMEKLPEVIDAATGLFREIKDLMEGMEEFLQIYIRLEKQQVTSSDLPTLPYKVRELKGRAVEKAKILEALLHKAEGESKESPILISITGPVGIGKTDLARAVYNSAQVEAEFDVRAWIYMGGDPNDSWWLTLQRSESASVDPPSKLHRLGRSSILSIFKSLETEITTKKVLIVLDNLTEWSYVYIVKHGAKLGCRIIATSQIQHGDFWRRTGEQLIVELDGLEEEEYLELFKECALGGRNRNKYPELEDKVGDIAKRYGGNPLAAVMIGRLLKSQPDKDHWRVISSSNLGRIDPTESNIMSVLRNSYEKLPVNLKPCYLACALFPKNFPFKKQQLFGIWNAIGFSLGKSRPPHWTNIEPFFVSSARKHDRLILHAIFHEFADYICDGEYFRLEDEIKEEDDIQIPDKARHVYVTADNFVKVYKVLQEKTHLRSLVICGDLSSEEHKTNFTGLLEEVLQNLIGLKLLMISVLPTGKLPDAIGGLRHLRYLELPINTMTKESIQELPAWLSDNRFVGLRQLRNLKELRGSIRKLKTGESSHSFKSIDPEHSSRESRVISVPKSLKFSKDDSEVLKEKTK